MLFFTSEYEEYLFNKYAEGMLNEAELVLLLDADAQRAVSPASRAVELQFQSGGEQKAPPGPTSGASI